MEGNKRQEGIITNKWFLGKSEFNEIENIRREVFMKELLISEEEEFDEFDKFAVHLLIYIDDIPVATGRIWHDGEKAMVGRLAVLKPFRGIGIGDLTIRLLLVKILKTTDNVIIHARAHLAGFYSKFGFSATGEEFIEAGLPHIKMTLAKEDFVLPSKCGGH